jgi:hypothetical protein
MHYREIAQAVAGGRFAPNVKGEVRRVKISPFALRTSNFVYPLPTVHDKILFPFAPGCAYVGITPIGLLPKYTF